jgi:lipopolysaccharide/colanic/teichoic acid biosynthesis glycosyltransferase
MIRLLDIVISTTLLALLSPLFVFLMLAISIKGDGRIFFLQERCGKSGIKFNLIKFATMKQNSADMGAGLFTAENDSRILPLGSFLRRSKLNEVPQLFNVIKGEMSLVGWRPLVNSTFIEARSISKNNAHDVLPGITSLASVIGRDEEAEMARIGDRENYYFKVVLPKKVELDDWWAGNRSLWNYIVILCFTAVSLVVGGDKITLKLLVGSEQLNGILR